jgi:hypothetical protein
MKRVDYLNLLCDKSYAPPKPRPLDGCPMFAEFGKRWFDEKKTCLLGHDLIRGPFANHPTASLKRLFISYR